MSTPIITPFVVTDASGREALAQCAFATVDDLKGIASWPRQTGPARNLATQDALEFAASASKRWRSYHQMRRTVASIDAMKRRISSQENTELVAMCVARTPWMKPSILGFALFRRTWCNHLVLDFLAAHPACLANGSRSVSGVGKGLLHGIAEIADAIAAKVLWGEATETSAPIYEHIFQLNEVDDLLYVPAKKLHGFRALMRRELKRSGLHLE